jgi:hypothetical protein
VVLVALVAGAAVGVAIAIAQRLRASSHDVDVAADPFGAPVTESEREIANV